MHCESPHRVYTDMDLRLSEGMILSKQVRRLQMAWQVPQRGLVE